MMDKDNVPIEEAINRAGFGLYSYLGIGLAGVTIISFACINYGTTILVPASACELGTTASQQGLLAAGPVVGSLVGTMIWGYMADKSGRRLTLLVTLLGGALFNGIASISVNWIMMLVLQFVASFFSSGLYSTVMSILSESVPMAKRNLVVLLVTSIFLLSQGIMAVLAIPIIPLSFSIHIPALGIYWNSWRTLMLVYSVPCLLSAIWAALMKESPKFVFSKGDDKQALEILRAIHRVNHLGSGKALEVNSIFKEEVKVSEDSAQKQSQVWLLFKIPLLKYTIVITILRMFQQIGAFVVWLPTVANQFVRIVETGEGTDQTLCSILQTGIDTPPDPDAVPCALNISALLIVLAVGAMQSFVNFCFSMVINCVGRRNIVFIVTLVCGVSGILVNLIPNAIGSAVMFMIMLQGLIVLGLYTAIAVDLFPTQLRALAIAFQLTGGRIATFASIQILNLLLINNCEIGFYLYASIFASSALVALFLPDDRHQPAAAASSTTAYALDHKSDVEVQKTDTPKELYRNIPQY